MEASRHFSCTFLMKAPISPVIPNSPAKIKSMAEIDAGKISFTSVGPGKTLASQPLADIGSVTFQPVSVSAQRLEIFWTSLARMGVFAFLIFIWTLCRNAADPMDLSYYILIILGSVILTLPFSLLLSGILAKRHEVLRLQFNSSKNKKLLSIEVEPTQETEVRRALASAGLHVAGGGDGEVEWQCERCGAIVDAEATICPVCGDRLD